MAWSDEDFSTRTPLEKVELLKGGLIAHATGKEFKGGDPLYEQLRRDLRAHSAVFAQLPDFIRSCSNLDEFWTFIRVKFPSYQERRDFLRESFVPALEFLEENEPDLNMLPVSEMLANLDAEAVDKVWTKALHRRRHDPEGAVTVAKTLLETVCKHILDDEEISYSDSEDLPGLWRLTAEHLNLTPEQHQDRVSKVILGNCQAVVNGLANLRTTVGDAHGQGRRSVRPRARHAELAVNLAGSMASFVVATWQERTERQSAAPE